MLLVSLVVLACSESTAPGEVRVTLIVASLDGPTFSVAADSAPTIACTANLRAGAAGPGEVTWGDAVVRFFDGADRSAPKDTVLVPAADVQAAWGSATIRAGQTEEFSIDITSDLPFKGEVAFHYTRQNGVAGGETVSFICGSTFTGLLPTPPTITTLAVEPVAGPVQPGDSLTLDYAAASSFGLWQTVISLGTPCPARWTFAEQQRHSVTRVVRVALPPTCPLGPIHIAATAIDAAELHDSKSIGPPIALVDATRPSIQPLFFPPTGGSAIDHLAGRYFVGDSLYFIFNATDNYKLRSLVWQVTPAGTRDSVLVSSRDTADWLKVPVLPGWVGPIQLRLFARDSVGLTSDTVVSAPESVLVDPTIARPVAWTTVNGEVRNLAIDQQRGVVYLNQANQRRIAVLSAATLAVVDSIAVPLGAGDLDLTASGDSLVLTQPDRTLGIVDLRLHPLSLTSVPLTILDTTTLGQYPQNVRVSSTGKALVSIQGSAAGAYTLIEVDFKTGTQRLRSDAGINGDVGGGVIERSQDRKFVVLNGGPGLFQSYDAVADTFGPRGSVIPSDWSPIIDSTGQHVAVSLDIYDRALQFVRRVQSPVLPPGILSTAFSGDGLVLYQGYGLNIIRSRISDGVMLDRSLSPVAAGFIRIWPDGTKLVIVDSNCCTTSRVAIMDMR